MTKISVFSQHFHADAKLIAYIESKLQRLNRFTQDPFRVEVYLKIQDTGAKIKDKIAEIRMILPGNTIINKETDKSFEAAINIAADSLKRQLSKIKEKKQSFSREKPA
jgi:putative sigma-54 modulation protein